MHHFQEKFDDIKGTIRNRRADDRQCNGQDKTDKRIKGQTIQWPIINGQMDKRTNNDLQNITQKNQRLSNMQGRLNCIIGPQAKDCTGAPTYTTTQCQ